MAAKDGIPINPTLVTWARERLGLSLDDVAGKFAHIADWETGAALPSYPQLEKLADELKLPIAVFFFPEPPTLPPIRESFRTLPDTEFEKIPRQVRVLLLKAKAMQLNLAELTLGQNPSRRLITRDLRLRSSISPELMATRVRAYLGVNINEQYSWPDDDRALKTWRNLIQECGIFIFKDAFGTEDYSGFSLYDDVFPIIYVKNSSYKTRQILTLLHELAHIVFRTSGIDTIDDRYIPRLDEQQKRIEILCNRFAAEFLVPADAFQAAMIDRDYTAATAELLAARFHVSREVIYRKFFDAAEITHDEYVRATRLWNSQKKQGSGGNYYRTKIAYLGREYLSLVFSQYHKNRIDDEQVAEYLDTKQRNVGTLEEYFTAGSP